MKFVETGLPGAFVIEFMPIQDERGFFARSFCRREFEEHGLDGRVSQCNLSHNVRKATLRGLHYQIAPHEETKLVRCITGRIYDVIVDLRPESPTFCRWFGVELRAACNRMVYVPPMFAHGYMTLEDHSEVFYQVSEGYHPEWERGARWDDPAFGITWPLEPLIMSNKDQQYPPFIS